MTENRTIRSGGLRRVSIDPLTRVEGHGKVTLILDETTNRVLEARLHIVEFRGFEKFIQGRPVEEVPILVQRLCGICPVSHLLAATKALDQLAGVERIPPAAEKLRRLLHYGQVLQSHALHLFYLAAPDLLFGFDSDGLQRNIMGLIERHRDIALKGIAIRRYGQTVIQAITGKRIHGVGPIPGGMNKPLAAADRARLESEIGQIVKWCKEGVELVKRIYLGNPEYRQRFAVFPSNYLSLTGSEGELELYHGQLRATDSAGRPIFDRLACNDYGNHIREEVKSWSFMKFPYLVSLGKEGGWYRVGPLARLNNCDSINTPLAEEARKEFFQRNEDKPVHASLAYHWARMIEAMHCAEAIQRLLRDPSLTGDEICAESGERRQEGIGVIEAPRGTLFHHYRIDERGLVEKANLIVSTTSNNQAMNEAIRSVATHYLDGHEPTPELLNLVEMAIRAYDPCLSCATHAVGKMPLHLELYDTTGNRKGRLLRRSNGDIILERQED